MEPSHSRTLVLLPMFDSIHRETCTIEAGNEKFSTKGVSCVDCSCPTRISQSTHNAPITNLIGKISQYLNLFCSSELAPTSVRVAHEMLIGMRHWGSIARTIITDTTLNAAETHNCSASALTLLAQRSRSRWT